MEGWSPHWASQVHVRAGSAGSEWCQQMKGSMELGMGSAWAMSSPGSEGHGRGMALPVSVKELVMVLGGRERA